MNKAYKYGIKMLFRSKRTWLLLIALTLSFATPLVFENVVNLSIYVEEKNNELFRLGDLVVYGDAFNTSFIYEVGNLSNVEAYTTFLTFRIHIETNDNIYCMLIYGIPKDPPVDTIPNIDWDVFKDNKIIMDPGSASMLGIHENDTLTILGRSFIIYKVMRVIWAPDLEYSGCGSIIMRYEVLYTLLNATMDYNAIHIKLRNRTKILETAYGIYNLGRKYNYHIVINPRFSFVGTLAESFMGFLVSIRKIAFGIILLLIIAYLYLDIRDRRIDLTMLEVLGVCTSDLTKIYIIQILILLCISVTIGVFISLGAAYVIIYRITGMLQIPVNIFVLPSVPVGKLIIIVVASLVLCYIIVNISLREFTVEKIVRRYHEETGSKDSLKGNITEHGFKRRILTRRILWRKTRIILISLLLATTIAMPSAIKSVIIISGEDYKKTISNEILCDVFVSVYDIDRYNDVKNHILNLPHVSYTEDILYAVIPIISIKSKKASIRPPGNYIHIFGLSGREKLIKFRFVKGSLKSGGIIITRKIALLLDVDIGDTIKISSYHYLGFKISTYFSVVGIIDTSYIGGYVLLFHKDYIASLTRYSNELNNTILIKLDSNEYSNIVARNISDYMESEKINGEIVIKEGIYKKIDYLEQKFCTWLLPAVAVERILLLLAALIIVRKELEQKEREVATLNALGVTTSEISNLYTAEFGIIYAISIPPIYLILWGIIRGLTYMINHTVSPLWIHPYIPNSALVECIEYVLILFILTLIIIRIYVSRVDVKKNLSIPE